MRPSLFGMLPVDLVAHLAAQGVASSEQDARRILSATIADGGEPTAPRRPVAKRILHAVRDSTTWTLPAIVDTVTDPTDGFTKFLFSSGTDDALYEAVRIPLEKPGTYTVCLSSQVGCAMACDFCATGRLGLSRSLTASDIVGSFLAVRRASPDANVRGAVFMGQGEPFHNYDEVIRAAAVLSDPSGARVDKKAITISTVGLVGAIRRFTDEGHPYKLIVSLTSTDVQRRRSILPVAGRSNPAELRDVLLAHTLKSRERITIAWVLMGGVNHGDDELNGLAALANDVPIRVNLIDVNDARENGYRRATDDERNRFVDGLAARKIPFIRRYSGGREREAACGMLAARHSKDMAPSATSPS